MLEAKAQGKIHFIGLTNHRLPVAIEACESGLYDTIQFPFSYLADIDKDNQEIKDRMYVMQSYMNENTFINYIFGADNFTDMLSRIDSFNTLTLSDQDLIAQMLEKKKEIENQKITLENAKVVLEEKRKNKLLFKYNMKHY